jgi:tetratricopeptide (TPR) repeat protein
MTKTTTVARENPAQVRLEASRLLTRADHAFHTKRRLTHSYHLYGEAIDRLEMLWDTTGSRVTGEALSEAYMKGSFPASHQFYRRGLSQPEKMQWRRRFVERYQLGVDLEVALLEHRPHVGIHELVGIQCHLTMLASTMRELGHLDQARHYVAEAHRIQREHGDKDETMQPSLEASCELIKANCFVDEGFLSKALECANKALELEQSYIDFRRKQKKKAPHLFMVHARKRQQEILAMIPKSNDMEKGA